MTKTYTTISGDRWDLIAYRELGSENFTYKLIEANLDYKDIFIFPAGVVLTLPEVEASRNNSLPPWKRAGA